MLRAPLHRGVLAGRSALHRLGATRPITTEVAGPWNFISGARCAPLDDTAKCMMVTAPATGRVLAEVGVSGREDVDAAVAAAKEAGGAWGQLQPRARGRVLLRAAGIIRDNLEHIALLEVKDTGKPIWEARVDVESCADAFEYFGGMAPSVMGQHIPLDGGSFALVSREPLGVIAGVGAWNFPMQTAVWKVAPALATGNTFVYKPSQCTPVTAVTVGEVLREAGAPPGVYGVVQGEGETGGLLCHHPDVAKVSFTGSVQTGVKVMTAAAEGVKHATLELGGKGPLIVCEDADVTQALKATMVANFLSQGQVCSNGTRVFVHESVLPAFRAGLLKAVAGLTLGDPEAETTTVGATVTAEHARKVLGYIERAVADGCTVACGGGRQAMGGDLAGGWYLQPTVLEGCEDHMQVVQEEVFGAVLCLLPFSSDEEVVQRANNSSLGLAGAVFTKDLKKGHRMARALQVGTCWLNTYNLYPTELPFGGYKQSGLGRENGTAALDAYTQTKTTYVELGEVDAGPLWQE